MEKTILMMCCLAVLAGCSQESPETEAPQTQQLISGIDQNPMTITHLISV